MVTLYTYYSGLLRKWYICDQPTADDPGEAMYFRTGTKELYNCSPTFFPTQEEAVAAAVADGYMLRL